MRHEPVLLQEVIHSLQLKPGMNVIDCTLGDAGHSEEILKYTAPFGRLLGIDADAESLIRAKQYLYEESKRVIFVRDNFVHLKNIVEREGFHPVHRILADFGWSSPQFAERGRGFSFQNAEEVLDMRYNVREDTPSAKDIVNSYTEDELYQIFRRYGEEKLCKEIARGVVEERKNKHITTVGDFVEIVLKQYRKKLHTDKEVPWIGGLHPATKVFQALRIEVNKELEVIETFLPQGLEVLSSGGILAVITFHSLEDRIVKHFFKKQNKKVFQILTKKPIICSEEEGKRNPRARSAKLRLIQKI
ncbi:MAG: 16S rRNA (cytosine(1402)-N(4))-methyltransferase RsmH [Candidatus Magasanikbacteria bacterium]